MLMQTMDTLIRTTILNALPVLKVSFFKWVKAKKFLIFQKRVIALLLFLTLFSFISQYSQKTSQGPYFDSASHAIAKVEEAKKKIKVSDNWKPQGSGSSATILELPKISAGLVLDVESGNVIWSKNLKERFAPASLSKLATVITAVDLAKLDQNVEVDENSSGQIPTKLGLKTGEELSLKEAISAAILTSANDATEALASSIGRAIGGRGTEDFMRLVNYKMATIGAKDSHFVNATGLDDQQQYSTVWDLAIIGRAAYKNKAIAEIAGSDYIRLDPNKNHKLFDLPNWNALLGTYPGVDGLKIGYTENAGHTTIVTAKRDSTNLMAIVIGAETIEDRERAAATLLNYGFVSHNIEAFPIDQLNLTKRFEDWKRQLSMAN